MAFSLHWKKIRDPPMPMACSFLIERVSASLVTNTNNISGGALLRDTSVWNMTKHTLTTTAGFPLKSLMCRMNDVTDAVRGTPKTFNRTIGSLLMTYCKLASSQIVKNVSGQMQSRTNEKEIPSLGHGLSANQNKTGLFFNRAINKNMKLVPCVWLHSSYSSREQKAESKNRWG